MKFLDYLDKNKQNIFDWGNFLAAIIVAICAIIALYFGGQKVDIIVDDLKTLLSNSGTFEYLDGHNGTFGSLKIPCINGTSPELEIESNYFKLSCVNLSS